MQLYLVYIAIIVLGLAQWAFNRFVLTRQGLAEQFILFRETPALSLTIERKLKPFIMLMVGVLIHCCFVWFAGYRLLYGVGLWDFESASVLSFIVMFFLKDRVHYETANFLLIRRVDK